MWPGKSFDTHGPIGPWVVTADEVDPAGLGIRTSVDGELQWRNRVWLNERAQQF
jgi:2-keto-4-pentenoate hydratase/2-oxohepta-3-ene-1,7-dioic acid hydratase in catechol pathway